MNDTVEDSIEVDKRSSEEYEQRPIKRARVALACQRCRARKQKCDGAQDSCSTCTRLGIRCHYKAHLTPKPDQKKLYITALEDRIAELENHLSTLGHDSVGDDHWKQKQNQFQSDDQTQDDRPDDQQGGEIDPALLEISNEPLSTSLNYVGGKITLGRMLGSVVKTQPSPKAETDTEEDAPKPIVRSELVERMGPMFVSPGVATRLLDGWVKHLSTRYPCIHTPRLRELHARRDHPLDVFEESVLHLVYANSGRVLETTGETGSFYADQHYEAALQNMDTVLELNDTRSIIYLLLTALYCLRGPKDPAAWTLAGLAVRLCIELGLHRKSGSREVTMKSELDVRLFWSCYYLDREMSVALARPPAISDNNMDVEFPIDINEDCDDIEALRQGAQNRSNQPVRPPTSLTTFIHFLRLRDIESKIEFTIYRVDRQTQITSEIVQGFLDKLHAWRLAIPPEYHDREDNKHEAYNGIDVFMILFFKCVRLLLYPLLSKPALSLQYLKCCASACAGICEAYKRLHRRSKADYSPLSLQSVFLAGLTLMYCTWLAPRNYLDVSGPISDCNIMLYVMAERWPAARKYRDVFEQIKMSVTDVIVKGNHQATRAAGILDAEGIKRCRALDQALPGGARTDYAQMISDMAKEQGHVVFDPKPKIMKTSSAIPQETSYPIKDSLWSGGTVESHTGSMQMSGFTDSNFTMSSLDDLESWTTEWDPTMWDTATTFNF